MPIFIFTDIEGSTGLWERCGAAMAAALERHDRIITTAVAAYGGRIVKHTGDGFLAVFDAGDPLRCALELQRALQGRDWGSVPIRVRVAVHGGDAEARGGDFFGPAVNRAARLRDAAWGGQILISQVAAALPLPAGAELRDLGVHLLKDLGEPERIFQLAAADLPLRDFPAPRSLSTRPGNLPPQSTPFVGREKELAAVAGLIGGEHCRLLTLFGPGGTGKTRLAIQAGAELADDFEWGVYFVPLVAASQAEHVPAAVAAALGYNFQGGGEPLAQLLAFLADKETLLILDNLEQLEGAAPFVAALLDRTPRVKVIATSRRRLALHAESVIEIGGMSYPASSDGADLEASSAVRLFVAAAARGAPSFRLAPADFPALLRICERVAGTALALELAAAWTSVLTMEEIAAELEIGFDLLTTEAADMAARHRSVRAVCEYSYNLLKPAEAAALRGLSVFGAPFSRDAALRVAAVTLPVLTALVNKSLVRRAGPGLYSFHDLVKGYARDMLAADAPAQEALLAKYRQYVGAFMEARWAALGENRQREATAEVTAVLDDVRAVTAAAVERRDAAVFMQIAPALNRYYSVRGLYAEAKDVFSAAAAAFAAPEGNSPPPESPYRAAYREAAAGWGMALARALDPAAPAVLARVIGMGVRDRHAPTLVAGINNLAFFAFVTGRLPWAAGLMEAGLKLARAGGEPMPMLSYLANLGAIYERLGHYDRAREVLNEAYNIAKRLGNVSAQGIILHNCASVEAALGDDKAAEASWAQALVLARELDNAPMVGVTLANLGELYLRAGRRDEARAVLEESLAVARRLEYVAETTGVLRALAAVAIASGDRERARELAAEGLRLAADIGDHRAAALLHAEGGKLAACEGRHDDAAAAFREAVTAAAAANALPVAADVLLAAAAYASSADNPVLAAETLGMICDLPLTPARRRDMERALAAAAAGLPAEEFNAAVARGRGRDWRDWGKPAVGL